MAFAGLGHGGSEHAAHAHAGDVLLEIAGHTHRGPLRPVNEDHFLVAELSRYVRVRGSSAEAAGGWHFLDPGALALIVADGMGGTQSSDGASALAAGAIVDSLWRAMPWPPGEAERVGERPSMVAPVTTAIEAAFGGAHRVVASESRRAGIMASTATLAFVSWPRLWIGYLGDSRAYLLRRGRLVRMTNDHTVAEELREAGILPGVASAYEHVLSHVLGGAGDGKTPRPDVIVEDLEPGDTLLLCTDGLTDRVSDGDLWSALACGAEDPQRLCTRLVGAALGAGGEDDVTVVVARVSGVVRAGGAQA
jgi:protein phosphatase